MKLIQIDNTLYIVEGENKYKVSEESYSDLMTLAVKPFKEKHGSRIGYIEYRESLQKGEVDITDIQHRIEIVKKYAQQQDSEVEIEYYEAFLLPEKEHKLITTYGGESILTQRTYSIEQIEKAIDEVRSPNAYINFIKKSIINNLKTKTT